MKMPRINSLKTVLNFLLLIMLLTSSCAESSKNTNTKANNSIKAKDIEQNPHVALEFLWLDLERQVRVIGKCEKISTAESMAYFMKRSRGSQIGAWVSEQSSIISSRKMLQMQIEKMKEKFANGSVPLPDFWGGYRVVPTQIEFWQGRESRLHDRILYTKIENDWKIARLAP